MKLEELFWTLKSEHDDGQINESDIEIALNEYEQSIAETQAKLDKAVEFIESGQHTYLGSDYVHCVRLTEKNKQILKELNGE